MPQSQYRVSEMSVSAYVSCKYHNMSTNQGSEELLVDIGSNSRIRVFSVFSINDFSYPGSSMSTGFVLKDGSGGSVIYSDGFSNIFNGAANENPGYNPFEHKALPEHGIQCFSSLYVEGIGTNGIKALTFCYQVG
jgi:hypothetical protein